MPLLLCITGNKLAFNNKIILNQPGRDTTSTLSPQHNIGPTESDTLSTILPQDAGLSNYFQLFNIPSYLLYYLKEVLKLEYASYCILSGQLADAVATPLVGYLSDRTETKIGKRMPWYIG